MQRQYTGTAGRIENAQVAVYLGYASPAGHALIDRELYLPRSWTDDPARCQGAGVPAHVGFATKPQLAWRMIERAVRAKVPFAWFAADEAYGDNGPQQRNFLATLLLSQGATMLLGGDESGRTQGGNNNAYCQDNEISWQDWRRIDEELLGFTRDLITLRREHPVLRRRRYAQGHADRGSVELGWYKPDGSEMSDDDWDAGLALRVGLFLNGEAITDRDRRGQRVTDDSFLLLFNAHHKAVKWTLPERNQSGVRG